MIDLDHVNPAAPDRQVFSQIPVRRTYAKREASGACHGRAGTDAGGKHRAEH